MEQENTSQRALVEETQTEGSPGGSAYLHETQPLTPKTVVDSEEETQDTVVDRKETEAQRKRARVEKETSQG